MTREQVAELVESFGLPYTYYQFPNDVAPALPFVCYYYSADNEYRADNRNYIDIETLTIELYTETRDFDLEKQVEDALPFPYDKTVEYINAERMYRTTYESEVIING